MNTKLCVKRNGHCEEKLLACLNVKFFQNRFFYIFVFVSYKWVSYLNSLRHKVLILFSQKNFFLNLTVAYYYLDGVLNKRADTIVLRFAEIFYTYLDVRRKNH